MHAGMQRNANHEIDAAVRDYFARLEAELRGRARWRRPLAHRADGHDGEADPSRYFRHVGAILMAHGLPCLNEHKPAFGYSTRLLRAVEQYLNNHVDLLRLMEADVDRMATAVPDVSGRTLDDLARTPPEPGEVPGRGGQSEDATRLAGVDYLGREQRNRSLAAAGESFVLAFERQRLAEAGREVLAEHLEHVSGEYGEGLGYDIHSYDVDGRDRFIQVKTTRFRKETPFYVSANEVAVSGALRERYWLYRVYEFHTMPCLYQINGPLSDRLRLEPQEYRATIR